MQAGRAFSEKNAFLPSWPHSLVSHLGLVPFLSLLEVLGGHALVLLADVTQGSREVGLGNIHIDLYVLFLNLGLQLLDFLRREKTEGQPCRVWGAGAASPTMVHKL